MPSREMTGEEKVWRSVIENVNSVDKLLWYISGGLGNKNDFTENIMEYLTSIEASCSVIRQLLSDNEGARISGQP